MAGSHEHENRTELMEQSSKALNVLKTQNNFLNVKSFWKSKKVLNLKNVLKKTNKNVF